MKTGRFLTTLSRLLTLALVTVCAPSAMAQEPNASAGSPEPAKLIAPAFADSFRLYRFDEFAGSERFSIASADGHIQVPAQGSILLGGRGSTFTQSLRVEERSYALASYELVTTSSGGQGRSTVRAQRTADSVAIAIEAPGGGLRRAFAVSGDVFVLDNLLVNHIDILARRIADRGFAAETIRVVVPQVAAVLLAAIVPRPTPEGDGSRIVELRIAGVVEELTFNANGRLDAVAVPAQGIRYERMVPGAPTGAARRPLPPVPPPGAVVEQAPQPTRALFEEKHVRFPSKGIMLDGILTLPRGGVKIPLPCVVFVHGSGPHDRDETIGPNRPFLDLARGLAVFGIASLRYDKRTFAAPQSIHLPTVTVQEETIDDALSAVAFLRADAQFDQKRVSILGHSLGGALAPLIAQQEGGIASLVILAGTLRPLDELVRDQIAYLTELRRRQGLVSPEEEAAARALAATLDSLRAGQLPPGRMIYGMTPHYLNDYRARPREAAFAAFQGPVLILHAGKDYQVTAPDLDAWRAAIASSGKTNVLVREFPALGHLFMPVDGEPSPASYMVPGTVDPDVISTIAEFLLQGRSNR